MKEKIFRPVLKFCICIVILFQVFCSRKTNFEKGLDLIKKGEYLKAVKPLNNALEENPQNPEVHYNLCLAYAQIDSVEQSLNHYLKLTELDSNLKDDLMLKEMIVDFLNLEPYPSSMIPMPGMNQFKGSFSPDGKIIAVEAAKRDIADIYLMKLDGTIIKNITKGGMNTDPDFSPSGEDIVFISNKDGKEELYLYNLKTKKTEQLTYNKAQELSPSFSPDGKEIVFTSNMYGKWEIFEINVKSQRISRLTKNDHWDGFPKFSQNDKWIVFSSKRNGSEDIYIMKKDGGEAQVLYSSTGDDNDPTLFNNKLYFKSNQSGNWEIYQLNLKNKFLLRLTNNSYPDWNIRHSKDGTKILLARKKTKYWRLYFINLSTPISSELLTAEIHAWKGPK